MAVIVSKPVAGQSMQPSREWDSSDYHALGIGETDGVELTGVCDTNLKAAEVFAANWGVPAAVNSPDTLLRKQEGDFVHVLAPPDSHHRLPKLRLRLVLMC